MAALSVFLKTSLVVIIVRITQGYHGESERLHMGSSVPQQVFLFLLPSAVESVSVSEDQACIMLDPVSVFVHPLVLKPENFLNYVYSKWKSPLPLNTTK